MKRIFLILLLTIIFIPFNINAKTIDSFACKYNIQCKDPSDYNTYDLGWFQVEFHGYNDGNFENGEVHAFYGNTGTTSDMKSITNSIGKDMTDYKNYGFGGKSRALYIMHGDPSGQNTAYFFSQSVECPKMYCTVQTNGSVYITVGTASYDDGGAYTASVALSPTHTLLYNNETGKWQSKENFYKSDTDDGGTTNKTTKDKLECKYELKPEGEYYETGIAADSPEEKVDVVLTTYYDPDTGNPLSYNVSANDSQSFGSLNSLNEDLTFKFKGKNSSSQYVFLVRKKQLQKMFKDKCLDESKLYLYLSQDQIIAGSYGYVLTTDKKEKEAQISDVDFDHNNSGNGKYDFELVEINLNGDVKSCDKILGPLLTKIVKTGITIVQIIGAIVCIVKGMILLIPAVVAKDADQLKKASKQLAILGIILALIIIFKPLVRIIGKLLEYDVSCIL